MRFGVDSRSFETDKDHAKNVTTPSGYDHTVDSTSTALLAWHTKQCGTQSLETELTIHAMDCTHKKLPVIYWRKVGMTSSPHGPYGLGYTRATMAITIGSEA